MRNLLRIDEVFSEVAPDGIGVGIRSSQNGRSPLFWHGRLRSVRKRDDERERYRNAEIVGVLDRWTFTGIHFIEHEPRTWAPRQGMRLVTTSNWLPPAHGQGGRRKRKAGPFSLPAHCPAPSNLSEFISRFNSSLLGELGEQQRFLDR